MRLSENRLKPGLWTVRTMIEIFSFFQFSMTCEVFDTSCISRSSKVFLSSNDRDILFQYFGKVMNISVFFNLFNYQIKMRRRGIFCILRTLCWINTFENTPLDEHDDKIFRTWKHFYTFGYTLRDEGNTSENTLGKEYF